VSQEDLKLMKKGVDVDKVDLNDYYGCLDSSDDDVGPAPSPRGCLRFSS